MFEKCKRRLDTNRAYTTMSEQNKVDAITKNLEEDDKMIDDATFRMHSDNIPLEYHLDLLKEAYDVENYTIFNELVKMAETRVALRRLEFPYVTDIDFGYKISKNQNVDNGFEQLPIDINEAFLRQE